jgi:hypothetical protein
VENQPVTPRGNDRPPSPAGCGRVGHETRTRNTSIILCSILFLVIVALLGCPHVIYAVPTLMNQAPRFPVVAGSEFVPIALRLRTEGHFLLFRLRVDGKNLEPTAGTCRRWFLRRGAREAQTARRSFCNHDAVRFYVAAGVPHTLEFVIGSEHTVAKRVFLEPGENLRWKMPITTGRVELPVNLEPRHSYTIRAAEEALHLRSALSKDAPTGTRWKVNEHRPIYYDGVEVGTLRIEVLRNRDRRIVSELSVPLYSGRLRCEPPFCAAE